MKEKLKYYWRKKLKYYPSIKKLICIYLPKELLKQLILLA